MTKKVDVEFYKSEGGLNEIYQQTGIHFAFVSPPKDGTRQCHKMAKCRDFLHDAVRAQHQKNACSIYSFSFNSKSDPPIDLRRMRMLVTKPNIKETEGPEFENKMKCALRLINHYEKMAKVSMSKLYKVSEKDKNGKSKKEGYLFIGPVFWMRSCFLTSMYTYLIRLGDKQLKFTNNEELLVEYTRIMEEFKKAGRGDNDLNYLVTCKDWMATIIKESKTLLFDGGKADPLLDSKVGINSYHNNGGIRSLCSGNTFDKPLNERVKALKNKKA